MKNVRYRDGLLAAALSLGLYVWTLAPGPVWGDSASLALQVHYGGGGLGTAGDHALFVALGTVFAWLPGDLARNVNLASAFAAAVAVGLVQLIGSRLGGSAFAGFAAAAALAVSHAFWQHAVMAEVYTLNAAFVALLIFFLLRWRDRGMPGGALLVAAAVFALGLTNHLVLASLLPGMAVFVLVSRPPGRPTLLAMAAGVAALVLCALFISPFHQALVKVWYGPPTIAEYFMPPAHARDLPREIAFYGVYLFYQFPFAGLALGLVGIRGLLRRDPRAALFLLVALGANALVFVKTTEWASPSTKYVFYIADYVVFAIFVGVGAGQAAARFGRQVILATLVACPVLLYNILPPVMHRLGVHVVPEAHRRPYLDDVAFFLNPSGQGDDAPGRYAESVFAAVAPGGQVIADYTPYVVLEYLHEVEGRRRDVVLTMSHDWSRPLDLTFVRSRLAAGRAVYLAGTDPRWYDTGFLREDLELVPAGPLYQVVPAPPEKGKPARTLQGGEIH